MRRHIRSPAFREGFADGFSSMFALFARPHYRRIYGSVDTVALAWHEVGEILNESCKEKGRQIGKETRPTEKNLPVNY